MTISRTCREEGGKEMREEMGSHENSERGDLEHVNFCIGLAVTYQGVSGTSVIGRSVTTLSSGTCRLIILTTIS